MSDLDQAIERWRQRMLESGLAQGEILEELESHLRDECDAQLRAGAGIEAAFATAAHKIGEGRALNKEFAITMTPLDHVKTVLLTTMNSSYTEPAWATYVKATTFVLPALFLAIISAIFVVPKLQQICAETGLPAATAGTFWNLVYSSIQGILMIGHHGVLITGIGIVCLILLEWRLPQWPRYRRAAIGFGAFVLNALVLLAFFIMFLAAITAAPSFARLPK